MFLANLLTVMLAAILSPGGLSSLDVSIHNGKLTIDVKNTELVVVLDEVARQGSFKVTSLDPEDLQGVIISETFINLPIKQGIDRLLTPWNYSYTTNSQTGTIKEIFLVSRKNGAIDKSPLTQQASKNYGPKSEAVPEFNPTKPSSPDMGQPFSILPETPQRPQEEPGLSQKSKDQEVSISPNNMALAQEEPGEFSLENLPLSTDEMP